MPQAKSLSHLTYAGFESSYFNMHHNIPEAGQLHRLERKQKKSHYTAGHCCLIFSRQESECIRSQKQR